MRADNAELESGSSDADEGGDKKEKNPLHMKGTRRNEPRESFNSLVDSDEEKERESKKKELLRQKQKESAEQRRRIALEAVEDKPTNQFFKGEDFYAKRAQARQIEKEDRKI